MNKSVKRKDQCGFTLIEIMIAMAVFAIGILAVGTMQISAVKGNSSASGLTDAIVVAQNQMEELMSLDDNDSKLKDTDNDGAAGLNDASAGSSDGMAAPYTGSTGISYNIFWNIAVNSTVTNAKQIRVIVQWRQNGNTRSVSIDSVR